MDGTYTHAEHTYIVETLENIKTPIITETYSLPEDIKQELLSLPSPFKSAYAECVFLRTYSRKKQDGKKETWAEMVIRVVEGTIGAYLTHFKNHGLCVDRQWLAKYSSDMAKSFFYREWSPPGRGLYAMGTEHTRNNGNAALNNCYACDTKNLVLSASFLMDNLMCGGGVGCSCDWEGEVIKPNKEDYFTFIIPDTRQGWVAAVELLLRAYIPINGVITNRFPRFDYHLIRPYGEPIHGFGGTASGPKPLENLLHRIEIFLDTYLEWNDVLTKLEKCGDDQCEECLNSKNGVFFNMLKKLHQVQIYTDSHYEEERKKVEIALSKYNKTYGRTRLVADIVNSIGVMVVAGNIRRSALLLMGEAGDQEFLDLKNLNINPERGLIYWMSNNTVRFTEHRDFEKYIPEIAKRIQDNGEPGFFNLINAKRYGRVQDTTYGEDNGNLLNPCLTGDTLIRTNQGWKRIDTLIGKPFIAIVDKQEYQSTEQGFWQTGEKECYLITLENGMKVEATSNHKFFVKGIGWTSIDNGLTIDDNLRLDITNFKSELYSKIISIKATGIKMVYDCTIKDVHCFNANGIIAHNCGEIILKSFEPCTLSTICPSNCEVNNEIDIKRVIKAAEFATFYATTVTCIKHHWGISNAVIARNRRIGISLNGITNIYEKYGCTYLITLCRKLYKTVRDCNERLAKEAGIPRAIRVTTVKPEGTLSIIMEVNAGVHFPICRYAKRRVGFAKSDELLKPLQEAGYLLEDSVYSNNMVNVIFPIESGKCRSEHEVSIFEQFDLAKTLQHHYADNSVSFTGHFSKERESNDVERVIALNASEIKACSMIPYSDNKDESPYLQLPFEEIDEKTYLTMKSEIKPVIWNNYSGEDASLPRGCTNDTCYLSSKD